jgi:hypothetical protein
MCPGTHVGDASADASTQREDAAPIGIYVRTAASLLSLTEALLACLEWAFVSAVPPKKTSNC